MKKKKSGKTWWIIILLFLALLGSCGEGNDTEEETETMQEKTYPEVDDENKEDFMTVFSEIVGEEIANGANEVLVKQIGFTEIEFVKQIDGTSNYEITADGIDMVITAMQDYYRVFIPNTSHVFYEDGEALMTLEQYKEKTISHNDAIVYYIMAQDIISQNLVNPNSADFPSINFNSQDIGFAKTGDIITVQSYVDAKNSFNAKVRSNWTVQFIPLDMNEYTYEVTYISIDGNKAGTYTDID